MKSSNRTFMELKYGHWFAEDTKSSVLIAPLWNWNIRQSGRTFAGKGSNRTFMELKLPSAYSWNISL